MGQLKPVEGGKTEEHEQLEIFEAAAVSSYVYSLRSGTLVTSEPLQPGQAIKGRFTGTVEGVHFDRKGETSWARKHIVDVLAADIELA